MMYWGSRMLWFGGVGQSVGGTADNVMVNDAKGRKEPRSCDGEESRQQGTYAFFAQLNMIADVI